MQDTCFLFAVIVTACGAIYPPNNQCGTYPNKVSCPSGFTCWREYTTGGGIGGGVGGGVGGMYGRSECVASMSWQCPVIMQGQNTWGFKRCSGIGGGIDGGIGGGIGDGAGGGIGGMQQCNTYQGERCCNGFCVKGPALISSGMGMSNGGVYSGAEKSGAEGDSFNKKTVPPILS